MIVEKKVKLTTTHAEFPATKFPGGILTAQYDEEKKEYRAVNVHNANVILLPEWIEPVHDENFEETYEAEMKAAREVMAAAQAKALEKYRKSKNMSQALAEETLRKAEEAKKKEEEAVIAAEIAADLKKKEEEKQKEDLRLAEIEKNRLAAQTLADTKVIVAKEITTAGEKVDDCNKELEVAEQKLSEFNADEKKQTADFSAEHEALVTEVSNKKTALENALADLKYKKAELKSLSELRTAK